MITKSAIFLITLSCIVLQAQKSPSVERIDPKLDLYIDKDATVEIIAEGFKW